MSEPDIRQPFEEFLWSVLFQVSTNLGGVKLSRQVWLQETKRAHEAWHAQRKEKRARRANFVAPMPHEVTAYSISIGWPLDGVEFCDHYETKAWCTSGTTKMANWQAAVRKWKSKGWKTNKTPGDTTAAKVNLQEPEDWRGRIKGEFSEGSPLWDYADSAKWEVIPLPTQQKIVDFMRKFNGQ